LGFGGWGRGHGPQPPLPNPQSPIPNPQSPIIFNPKIIIQKKINKNINKKYKKI